MSNPRVLLKTLQGIAVATGTACNLIADKQKALNGVMNTTPKGFRCFLIHGERFEHKKLCWKSLVSENFDIVRGPAKGCYKCL